ncbi:MAG TPA: Mur ligase family protein, partial [Chitinophagaceae bacterium]|nr:Mur ligase family protein [Chitinophagaceae bacterium]
MKKLARNIIASMLGYQVRKLCSKNDFKVIGVVGSIGKTSTKLAIAQVLSKNLKVRYQEGNYNDLVTVPLVFFGEQLPSLFNPLAWSKLLARNQKQLKNKYPFDVVVIELGSDAPGQIARFKKFLKLEIAVVTAITPEHMQNFSSIEDVANEELAVKEYSSLLLVNQDLTDGKYIKVLSDKLTYGVNTKADYSFESLGIPKPDISLAEQYSLLAAAAVAVKLGLPQEDIAAALGDIKPFAGRMQRLKGIKDSTIIDDSYNASPAAMKLALDELYKIKAPQKIALLGNMNELGDYAKPAHEEIGSYCDPKQLDLVVTLGPEANQYQAPAAQAKGCQVKSFDSPYDAGEFIKSVIKDKAAVLIKGS